MPDGNLAQVVRVTLGITELAPILKQDMKKLTILDVHDLWIVNITGLEYATQLESFSAGGNHSISDLSPLENLPYLRTLDLSGGGKI